MENINFICGKTPDGRIVTLDGFRVESYASYSNDKGQWLVDIYFKSGQEVTLLAEDEKGEFIPIPDQLDACLDADPEIVTAPHPAFNVMCRKIDNGSSFKFNPNDVEFYITSADEKENDIELHFASGRTVTVRRDAEVDDLDGESLEVVIDDCICRYFKEDADDSHPKKIDDDDECDNSFHRKHVFLTHVFATVGQIRKDLEEIVKLSSDSYLSYSESGDGWCNDSYISGIQEWKGLVLLTTSYSSGDEEDYDYTVEDLLNALDDLSEDTGVLLQNGWELRNLRPNLDSGKIFWYDEDTENNYFEIVPCDIRLISADELHYSVKDFAQDIRLVCRDKSGRYLRVYNLFDKHGLNYICITDGDKGEDAHVSDLTNLTLDESGTVVLMDGSYYTIAETDKGVFFEDKIGDENVIAFCLGEPVYTSEDHELDDEDLFSDDDMIVWPR